MIWNRFQRKARPNRFVPQLESLENRWCPSSTVGIQVLNNTMLVMGDTLGDTINITDDGAGNISASVSSSGGTATATGSGIQNIFVFAGQGNDTFNYALSSALTQNEKLFVDLGRGTDQATFDFSPGVSNARLRVQFGGRGSDQVTANFGDLTDARVRLFENLGKGTNQATVNVGAVKSSIFAADVHTEFGTSTVVENVNKDITDSIVRLSNHFAFGGGSYTGNLLGNVLGMSDVDVASRGGLGATTQTVNAAAMNVDANSDVGIRLLGSASDDNLSVQYGGQVNGALAVLMRGGPGNDTLTQNLTANSGSNGTLVARERTGSGTDNATLNVTDNSGGTLGLNAELFAKATDTITNTSNVKVITF